MNELTIKTENAVSARNIADVTSEIKELCRQAKCTALWYAVEIGRRLAEAKTMLEYGEWGDWLKNEVDFSQSSANNFMKLFDEYGAQQISLFGAVTNSQTFANLPYSKALQLLAIPTEEREKFAEEVNADELSVRELQSAIKERNDARKEAAEEKARANELEGKLAACAEAEKNAKEQTERAETFKNRIEELEKSLGKEKEKAKKAKEALEKAKNNPEIPAEILENLRAEAEKEAEALVSSKAEKELLELKAQKDAAEKEINAAKFAAENAKKELEEAQKRLRTASPEVTEFKVIFNNIQSLAAQLHTKLDSIRETDPETAEKLGAALKAFAERL